METIINIENENLANYIMFKLDKVDNGFTEEELNEIIEYAKEFNKTHERMKLTEEPFIERYQNTVGFGNRFPELDKK